MGCSPYSVVTMADMQATLIVGNPPIITNNIIVIQRRVLIVGMGGNSKLAVYCMYNSVYLVGIEKRILN